MTQKMKAQTETQAATQADSFLRDLWKSEWVMVADWSKGGHVFRLLVKDDKRILIQFYPQGDGFQVWRPITDSNRMDKTKNAIEAYEKESQ